MNEVLQGDCREVMRKFPDNHFGSCVTDPPYELGFMGKKWDANGIAYDVSMWAEVFRVLKPGAHLLAFGGTRTYHRMTCAIEDAGFEIRDSLHWIYGSGFPKSLDVSKAIDKASGAEREIVGYDASRARPNRKYDSGAIGNIGGSGKPSDRTDNGATITAPATEDAARWEGWSTALKPAHEPIVMARKPLTGTVAANVLHYGTGALNIDGCRVEGINPSVDRRESARRNKWAPGRETGSWANDRRSAEAYLSEKPGEKIGRWAPNILLTHSVDCNGDCAPGCPVAGLDAQSGVTGSGGGQIKVSSGRKSGSGSWNRQDHGMFDPDRENTGVRDFGDMGGASRFFPVLNWDTDQPFLYCAKAPKSERPFVEGVSSHPTVKPLKLMRWLVRLVTPPGGVILDPFAGTGTTGEAARLEGFRYALIEREPDYVRLINARLRQEPILFDDLEVCESDIPA